MSSVFSTYCTYILVKAHFKGNCDYFKYGGSNTKLKVENFEKRTDVAKFARIAEKVNDIPLFFASNLAYDSTAWVGDMDPSDNEPYQRAKKFIENPLDIITKDLKELKYTYLIESLKCEGPSAKLASAVSGGRVMLETAAILANNIEFIETWKNSTNPVDITLMKKITNYSPFIAARINAKILMQAIKNVKNS